MLEADLLFLIHTYPLSPHLLTHPLSPLYCIFIITFQYLNNNNCT